MARTITSPPRSARKPKGDGHLRRAEILEAAEQIFVAEGYQGATIRRIAEVVGVSSTALYLHFPDKQAILREICEQTLKELTDSLSEIAAQPVDAVQRVTRMMEAYMRWGLAHPNAYRLVYMAPKIGSDVWSEGVVERTLGLFETYRNVVREIGAEGRLRLGDAQTAAQVSWMACHGLLAMLIARPRFYWESEEGLMAAMLTTLVDGLVRD